MSVLSAIGGVAARVVTTAVPPKTKSLPYHRLTDWERYFIAKNWMKCPDCETGSLVEQTLHHECNQCGATFRIDTTVLKQVFGERVPR